MRPKLLMENDYILRQCVGIDVSKETLVVTMCMFSFAEEAHYSGRQDVQEQQDWL